MARRAMNRTERGSRNVMKSRARSSNGRKGARRRSRVATAVSAGVGTISRRVGALSRGVSATTGRSAGTAGRTGTAFSKSRRGRKAAVGTTAIARRRSRPAMAGVEKRPVGRPPHLPIDNYGMLSIQEIRSRLAGLKKADLRKVMNFERRHRGRQTIISHIERRLKAA